MKSVAKMLNMLHERGVGGGGGAGGLVFVQPKR